MSGEGGKGSKGQCGGGGKGCGGGGKGYGAKGQGTQTQNSGKGRDDWKQDTKDVICFWCRIKGHFRKNCNELAAYKIKRDTERAAKGDHSVYVNPRAGNAQGPTRGAGSLDDDYTEEVVGLTGDTDADALDEIDRGKLLQEIEDFEEVDDDEDIEGDNNWDWACCVFEKESGALIHRESCGCCPARCSPRRRW